MVESYQSEESYSDESSSISSFDSVEEVDNFDDEIFNSRSVALKEKNQKTSLVEMNSLDPTRGGPDFSKSKLDTKSQLNSPGIKPKNKLSSLAELEIEKAANNESGGSSPVQTVQSK